MKKVSLGQCFRLIYEIDDGVETGACREYTLLRDHDDCERLEWIHGFRKIVPVIQVRVTYFSGPCGIAIQGEPMLNNGPLSWIVISRPNRYVDEVYEEKEEPSCDEEMTRVTSIEISIATKQQEQSSPPSNHPSKTFIPIGQ